jgi:hypothetical protein
MTEREIAEVMAHSKMDKESCDDDDDEEEEEPLICKSKLSELRSHLMLKFLKFGCIISLPGFHSDYYA